MRIERRSFLRGLAAIPLLSTGCGETTETNLPPAASVGDIRILTQSWRSSQLISKIAELLLREQLAVGASSVATPEGSVWEPLAAGTGHACLEVWPLRNAAGVRQFLDTGLVASMGSLGVGRSAFFVPQYVVDAVPEITTATAAAGLPDVLVKAGIDRLLVGPADWLNPSAPRLAALGLGALPVTPQATEKSFLEAMENGFRNGEKFMASLWYPHPIHSRYPLRAVGLPAASGCDAKAEPFGCDYPAETILKVAAPGLKFTNPDVFAFLQAYAPPLDDITALLAGSQDAPEVLARNWIRNRNVVWTPWVNAAKGVSK